MATSPEIGSISRNIAARFSASVDAPFISSALTWYMNRLLCPTCPASFTSTSLASSGTVSTGLSLKSINRGATNRNSKISVTITS